MRVNVKEIRLLINAVFLTCCAGAQAQVITDGTVGARVTLDGSDVLIDEGLGSLSGNNLFHSFQTFNIEDGGSATFTGASSIQNVISRVTGNEVSNIQGILRSEIGNADFYFINPNGVVFGDFTEVDVPAAFHVSSASTLVFADGATYSAADPTGSVLSLASPEAFGFLGTEADVNLGAARLEFESNTSISFSAPNLSAAGLRPSRAFEIFVEDSDVSILAAGNFQGEVAIDQLSSPATGLNGTFDTTNTFIQTTGEQSEIFIVGGNIQLGSGTVISGLDGASVNVTAGQLNMNGGQLFVAQRDDEIMQGGSLNITASTLRLSNGGNISNDTRSATNAGAITIFASENIDILGDGSGFTGIESDSGAESTGDAGNITITSGGDVLITNGGHIRSETFSSGSGGNVDVNAAGNIVINGTPQIQNVSESRVVTGISSSSQGTGAAGTTTVTAGDLLIEDSGLIGASDSSGLASAGEVTINVEQMLTLDGLDPDSIFITGIVSDSSNPNQPGGSVTINANNIAIVNGSRISAVSASDTDPGNITIEADSLIIDTQGTVSGRAVGLGSGGEVSITIANEMQLSGNTGLPFVSGITTEALNSGAGSITVEAGSLFIDNARITTSTDGSTSNGGNIDILGGPLVLDSGLIQANAVSGQGGEISIGSSLVVPSGNVLLSDTEQRIDFSLNGPNVVQAVAVDGVTVPPTIDSPDVDVAAALSSLDQNLQSSPEISASPCAALEGNNVSSLIQLGRGAVPQSQSDAITADLQNSAEVSSIEHKANGYAAQQTNMHQVKCKHDT